MNTDELYLALDQLEITTLDGVFYRHTAPHREPLSGVGSAITGARWNPPGTETLYLARPMEACAAEFHRMAERQGRGPESFVPRAVHTIAVTGLGVIDLTEESALQSVGLTLPDMTGPWEPCQRIGEAVDTLGIAGILAPDAGALGAVLAVFVRHAHRGELNVISTRMSVTPL